MESSASNIGFYALIAAAGGGSRLGGDTPKQYLKIGRKTILNHAVDAFMSCPGLKGLKVIIDPAHEPLFLRAFGADPLPAFVFGSDTRKSSINNGLYEFCNLKNEDIVLIHDAARPFVTREQIEAVAAAAHQSGAATLAAPVSDTLKKETGGYVDRDGLHGIQTPQGFHYGLITKAHESEDECTDDTGLVAALGHEVKLVPGSRENFKITTMDDLKMAKKLIPRVARTGFGYDVHAFTDGGKVRLCGVDIPHNKSLAGHSDADVGLHAITDALLGAIAAGDIGQHFPPSDPQWKGADSSVFLKRAVEMIRARGGEIVNIDLTVVCEAPKIGPHREKMQARVAQICGIAPDQVGIKATTTEGLGFTGRSEGIAAQAVTNILT